MLEKNREILKWQKRYQREKNARLQAEKLLEEKSSLLYSAKQKLENQVLEESTKFKREEEKFTALFRHSKDGIILHGEAGEIIDANKTICDLLGLPVNQLIGRHITCIIPNTSYLFIRKPLQEIRKTGNTRFECELLDRFNKIIPVEVSATRFQVGGKNIVQGIIRDITENKKVAKELEVATKSAIKANESKSLFLATMSHEIRTPLNGIIGFTDLLLQGQLSDEHNQHLKLIKKSGDILLNVINDILDFSRTESGQIELEQADYSVTDCVQDILDIHSQSASFKKVELLYFIDPSIPDNLHGDAGRLKQVLLNLVSNGLKFTNEGAVTINVTMHNPDYIKFTVTDTGIGFDETIKEQLFQPFLQADASTTRKYGGTGLGLAICKQLLSAMGGSISASSTIGKGSEFTIILPYVAAVSQKLNLTDSPIDLSGYHLMTIDDNQVNLDFMEARLKKWGAQVTTCLNPNEALNLVIEKPQDYDLLLVDMLMPNIDGFEFATKLLGSLSVKTPPMILLTSSREITKNEALKLGFNDIIYKPIKESRLRSSIKSSITLNTQHEQKHSTEFISKEDSVNAEQFALIVEDNKINAKLITLLLTRLGIKADTAQHGDEAIKILENEPKYAIIFMDMQMPVMDGLEATMIIRNSPQLMHYKYTPIIAMTANVLAEDEASCLATGMNNFISKPIDPVRVKEILFEYHII